MWMICRLHCYHSRVSQLAAQLPQRARPLFVAIHCRWLCMLRGDCMQTYAVLCEHTQSTHHTRHGTRVEHALPTLCTSSAYLVHA
jgi:hypothetical protein